MIEYPKIESLFNRDKRGKFIVGEFKIPEFEYLYGNQWHWTEKVNGTNIRIMWDGESKVTIGGRTDDAQIRTDLVFELLERFTPAAFGRYDSPMCLYGEGYGAKVQKGGGNYLPDRRDFVLFDVRVGDWWLKWDSVKDVASKLCIMAVPTVLTGTIADAVYIVEGGLRSHWGAFDAEGLVGKPMVDLTTRAGKRIVVKLKGKDFA